MKRKAVNTPTKPTKPTKGTRKTLPPKVTEEVVNESEEEVEVPVEKVAVTKKTKKAVTKKTKKILEPEPEDEEVEEEVDEEQEVEENEDDEENEEEAVEDEDVDEEDVDEENVDEDDVDEEDDDGDDGPSEEVIGTEEPTIPSKVKAGPIPDSVEVTKIIHVNNLPRHCKQIHIVEVFAKYGAIDQIHILTTPTDTSARIAYKTEKAAISALADDNQVKILGNPVVISMKKENKHISESFLERSVYVKNLKPSTTEEQITEHFESCGTIESVKMISRRTYTFAYVNFADKSAVLNALKLHNSILNGVNIKVSKNTRVFLGPYKLDTQRTVVLRNKQSLENIEVSKLEAIFSKCGEIEYIEILCQRSVIAFITFTKADAVAKALKLTGKTQEGIELEVETYVETKKWTAIHVSNIPYGCTEQEILQHFSNAGEVKNVVLKNGYAIVRFNDSDGYCKSFLYNESYIRSHMIFIEPHSQRKQAVWKKGNPKHKGFKRSIENGSNNKFKAKKTKQE